MGAHWSVRTTETLASFLLSLSDLPIFLPSHNPLHQLSFSSPHPLSLCSNRWCLHRPGWVHSRCQGHKPQAAQRCTGCGLAGSRLEHPLLWRKREASIERSVLNINPLRDKSMLFFPTGTSVFLYTFLNPKWHIFHFSLEVSNSSWQESLGVLLYSRL